MTNEYNYTHLKPIHEIVPYSKEQLYSPEEMEWLKSRGMKTTYEYEGGQVVPRHNSCIACAALHIIKYDGHPAVEDKVPFAINCKGIPGQRPNGSAQKIKLFSTQKGVSEKRATLLFNSSIDPVAWAELMFGFNDSDPEWNIRWYQKEILRDSAKRMVLRWGRRSGKSFTMALKLLYIAFTQTISKGLDSEGNHVKAGPQIIVATPFQAQLTNIFDELEKLLKRNVDLSAKVKSKHGGSLYTKSPFFLLELMNGATISGFVTGVEIRQDGSAGGSIRGQSGNIIYVDEMDMIPEEVLEKVIIPILATSPGTSFFATSTPIGKAGKFFDIAKNRPDFKEMWLPSTVLPQWDEFKGELEYASPTDDGFIAEYMAEFVESSSGVFKATDVYAAMRNYTYVDSQPDSTAWWRSYAQVKNRSSDLVVIIGIDWNKNAGSEFVVVAYDQVNHRWWVVDTVNINAGQFNSVRFKEEVWRLNFKWKPDYIYADEGYGHHIIDDIHYEAHRLTQLNSHPDANVRAGVTAFDKQKMKLGTRLKKFNFSQKVELTNPVDNTVFTRTGKEFLVENAIRVFEEGRISFPADETTIRQQMLNYIVLRRNKINGRPVYGLKNAAVGDHRLDALMLALGGLFLERNPVYSRNAVGGVSDTGIVSKDQLHMRYEGGDADYANELPPAMGVKMLQLQRGSNPEQAAQVMNMLRAGQDQTGMQGIPHQREANRSNFPGSKGRGGREKTPLEQLWESSPSYNGYEDDTRPFYEAKAAVRKQQGLAPPSGFVARQPGRNSGSSTKRGSAW